MPFEVACARCGHDLRGRKEPICPACKLEFDWAQAVPIEQLTCATCDYHLYGLTQRRCPECGSPFSWEEALARYHRQRIPLFEYQWRQRPFRSLVSTWFRALRPGRFWRSIDIHDPPQTRALLGMFVLTMAAVALLLAVLQGVDDWLWNSAWTLTASGYVRSLPRLVDLLPSIAQAASASPTYAGFTPLLLWLSTSMASLLVFQQSMRRHKVRIVHVLRVCVYATSPPVLALVIASYIYSFVNALVWNWYINIEPVLTVLLLIGVIACLRNAYAHYLRIPHSWGIAVASQAMALLAAGVLESLLAVSLSRTAFYSLLEFFHVI